MKKLLIGISLSAAFFFTTQTALAATVKVSKGDTLYSIAKKNQVSVADVMKWNKLTSSTVYIGQVLNINKVQSSVKEVTQTKYYKVVKGDTLYKVGQKNKVSTTNIKNWNHMKTNTVYIGQKLIVALASKPSVAPAPAPTPAPKPEPTPAPTTPKEETPTLQTYKVVKGDYLSKIASNFHLTLGELRYINHLKSDTIFVGQVLVVDEKAVNMQFSTEQLVTDAKALIGTPYVWGGTTTKGFDCSGFVQYVYQKQFIYLPRTTQQMWDYGKTTTTENLKVGDLVFFTTYAPGPTHVGIFIGDNQMIQAGTSTGVTITSMDNSYFKPRYLGAKSIQ
jgi:cell wall-associated NlpC family hydrolase